MAAVDTFSNTATGLMGPAENAFEIAPHDTNELAYVTRGISVAEAGDVTLVTANGDEVTAYLAAGVIHPIRAKQILDAGTDATGIVGWY